MWEINGNDITLTRGDSFECSFPMYIKDEEGNDAAYELNPGDIVRFAVKKKAEDPEPLIIKILDGYDLELVPQDTICLDFGVYYYDVHITYANGKKATYIKEAKLRISKEDHRKWK